MGPVVVSAWKLGAMLPRRRGAVLEAIVSDVCSRGSCARGCDQQAVAVICEEVGVVRVRVKEVSELGQKEVRQYSPP